MWLSLAFAVWVKLHQGIPRFRFLQYCPKMHRPEGATSSKGPQLVEPSCFYFSDLLKQEEEALFAVFHILMQTEKDTLAYVNNFVPFVHVLMKRKVPVHLLGHPNGTMKIQEAQNHFVSYLRWAGNLARGQISCWPS